ncbi:MAG: class I SAM-dependent methyltransferase [Candidatus Acidiferrum sp.]
MTFVDAKQRFSNRVTDYIRYRPGYPSALWDLLAKECGLLRSHVVADIGSGTGLLGKLFLDHGNPVYGVEPNAEMRAGGEEFLRGYPNFTSINGSAEATTLAASSVDFVAAGQAFHWFDPVAARREFLRILKTGGFVVIAWNDRRISESRFGREYEDLLVRYGTDYTRVKEAYPEAPVMQKFFGDSTFQSRELPNFQEFDFAGLSGRLRSSSYAPQEGHVNYPPMMEALEKLFASNQVNGRVRMTYTTQIYFGQLKALRHSR